MEEEASTGNGRKKNDGEKSGGRSQQTPSGTASAPHTQSKAAVKLDNKQAAGVFLVFSAPLDQ